MDSANVPAKLEVCSFTRSWDNSTYVKTWGSPHSLDMSFKVTKGRWFWYQSKARIWLLLVRNSNLDRISRHFGDIAGFFSSWVTPTLFHPNFGGVLVALDRPFWGQREPLLGLEARADP